MKKLLALILLVLIVFAVLNRDRIYVRDPLASITRDGTPETGVQVFINHRNDVLLEHDDPPRYLTLIQQGQPIGVPKLLHCLHFLACMTDSPNAPVFILSPSAHLESATSKQLTFRDNQNRETIITLH